MGSPKVPRPNWEKLREALWERAEGRCEVTGQPLDFHTFDAHHRRPKGMGGSRLPDRDSLSNLLALDPLVHNGGPESVHARRGWAEEHGYLLPKDTMRAVEWPVAVHQSRWVYLLADGRYVDVA